MSDPRAELIKQARDRSDDYRRGLVDGRQQALAELQPQVVEMAEKTAAAVRADDVSREVFRGQASAQAAAYYLGRFKSSMKLGLCWRCGNSAPEPSSPYQLCNPCTVHTL